MYALACAVLLIIGSSGWMIYRSVRANRKKAGPSRLVAKFERNLPMARIEVSGPRPKCDVVRLNAYTPSATASCGHLQWQSVKIVYGLEVVAKTVEPLFSDKLIGGRLTERCVACDSAGAIGKFALCAYCDRVIRPGEGVCLYKGPVTGRLMSSWKTADGRIMACTRWGCGLTGGVYAGIFDGDVIYPSSSNAPQPSQLLYTGRIVYTAT